MNKADAQPHAVLQAMQSLADPLRLRILRLLEREEIGVAELCQVLQMPQSSVSRHLKVLVENHWVVYRRAGTASLYRLSQDQMAASIRKLWVVAREQTLAWPAIEQDRLRLERVLARRQTAKHSDSRRFFESAADRWDAMRQELYGNDFQQAAFLSLIARESVVADLGCGTGRLLADLSPYVRKVIGVDHSSAMLQTAKKRIVGLKNVELVPGSLESLPLEDRSCDAAFLILALTYVEKIQPVLHEAVRILRAGGRLILVDLLLHDREDFRRQMGQVHAGFDAVELEKDLKTLALKQVYVRPLPPPPDAKGPALLLAVGCVPE